MADIDTSTAAITAIMDGVTDGPWEWGGYPDDLRLQTVNRGKIFVMTFGRKGMQGGQPRFNSPRGMVDASNILQFQVGDREIVGENAARKDGSVYRYDVRGVNHPAARFIAASRQLVPALLAERDAQQATIAELQDELQLMKTAGVIEVAARNPFVADYMCHWEVRAEQAEARVAELARGMKIFADDANWFDSYDDADDRFPSWRGPSAYPEIFAQTILAGENQ